jgi:putative membrane protein
VNIAAQILIALVALLHLYFLALEMFFWDQPLGRKAFNLTPEFATASKKLAANQGLYNGFLAAGLIWSLILGGREGFHVAIFFLACVIVAGIYGALTVNKRIFFFQALPALVALAVLHIR